MENKNSENKLLKFKKVTDKLSRSFVIFGSKIGSNKMLAAIRDAFAVASIPMLGAAFPVIIGMVFFQDGVLIGKIPGVEGSEFIKFTTKYIALWFWSIWDAAVKPFTLLFVVCIGYFMSKSYLKKASPLTGAIVTVACFMTLFPFGVNWNEGIAFIGTDGILLGVFVGLVAPYCFAKLMNYKKLRFKMPDTVPPVIAEVFASIISITIMLLSFSLIGKSWQWIAEGANIINEHENVQNTLFKAIQYGLAVPFQKLGTSAWSTGAIIFFVAFFWFFGLHGSNILAPVTNVIWTPLMYDNASYWKLYLTDPNMTGTGPGGNYWELPINIGTAETPKVMEGLYPLFNQNMAYIGGTGATLGFLIAIFIFSKYKPYREVAKLSIGPGVFGINEPVIFGVPIIFNVTYFIPYVFGMTIIAVFSHLMIRAHWVRPVVVPLGWTPFLLQNLMMTAFDWRTLIIDSAHLTITFGVWLLFLPIGEKVQKTLDAKEMNLSFEEYNEKMQLEWKEFKEEKAAKRLERKTNKKAKKHNKTQKDNEIEVK